MTNPNVWSLSIVVSLSRDVLIWCSRLCYCLFWKNKPDLADTLDIRATSNPVFWDTSQSEGFAFYLTLKKSLDL